MNKEMIKLTVKARDVDELLYFWKMLGNIIEAGKKYGTLMDGWDIAKVNPDDLRRKND